MQIFTADLIAICNISSNRLFILAQTTSNDYEIETDAQIAISHFYRSSGEHINLLLFSFVVLFCIVLAFIFVNQTTREKQADSLMSLPFDDAAIDSYATLK